MPQRPDMREMAVLLKGFMTSNTTALTDVSFWRREGTALPLRRLLAYGDAQGRATGDLCGGQLICL